jgi:hypothetical protein
MAPWPGRDGPATISRLAGNGIKIKDKSSLFFDKNRFGLGR